MNNFSTEASTQGWHRNTDLGVELKTILHSDRRMKTGQDYPGVLRRDSEAIVEEYYCRDPHYTFVETVPMTAGKRYPRVFDGRFITITRHDDGALRPNFKSMPVGMSADNYAFEVYRELRQALKGLVGE